MVIRLRLFLVIFFYSFLASRALAQCPQSVGLGPNQNICGPDTITLVPAFTGNAGPPSSINWYLNGTVINTSANQLDVLSSAPGTYVIEAAFGACIVYDTILVTSTNLNLSLPFVSSNGIYYNPIDVNGIQTYPLCSGLGTTAILIENAAYQNNLNPAGTTYSITYGSGTPQSYLDSATQTASLGNNYFTITAQNGACSLSQTYNVYSGTNPFVSLGALNSIGICPGNPVTFVIDPTLTPGIYNPPGTTYTLSFNDDTTSVFTYTNLTNDQIVYYVFGTTSCGMSYPTGSNFPNNTFYAQVTAQNACGQTVSTVSPITVNSLPTPGFTISDTTICVGNQVTVTNTGISGNIVSTSAPYNCTGQAKYYWLLGGGTPGVDFILNSGTLGNFNGNFNSILGNGSANLNITYLNPGNYTVSQIQYNSCGSDTLIQHICVIEAPICGFTLDTLAGCSPLTLQVLNSSVAPSCSASPVPLNYQWSLNTPTGTTGNISNAAAAQPTIVLTNTTNLAQTFILTLNVSPLDPAGGAFGTPNCSATCQQSVTIWPELQLNIPPSATICHGASVNTLLNANIPATINWQATNQLNILGESTSSQNTALINDVLYNTSSSSEVVNYQVTGSATLGACPDSISFAVNVLPNYTMNAVNDISVCAGTVVPGQNFSSTYPAITYTWVNNNPNIGLNANGTGSIPSFTALNSSNTNQIAQIIVTPQSGACVGIPDTFQLTVLPLPVINTVPNLSICAGDQSSIVNFSASLGNSLFSWTNNNIGIGLAPNGSGSVPAFTALNASLSSLTATVTVLASAGSCVGPALQFNITVLPLPQIQQVANQIICAGSNTNSISFTGLPAGNLYAWVNNNPNIGLSTSGQGNIPSFIASNSGSVADTALISLSATNNGCMSSSYSFQVIVLPLPSVGQPANITLCHQENYTGSLFNNPNGVAGTSYIWTNDNPNIGLVANGAGMGLPGFVASNLGTTLSVANLSVQASANGCLSAPIAFQIGVNPNPIVLAQGPYYYCDGEQSTGIYLSASVSGATFSWNLDNPAIGLFQNNGQDSIPSFPTLNSSANLAVGNFSVSASFNGCVGPSQNIQVVVNPTPIIDPIPAVVVCAQTNVDINFTSSTQSNGNNYTWTNTEPAIGLPSSGSASISFLSQNSTSNALVAQISVTPTYTNGTATCIGLPTGLSITVHPSLIIDSIADQTICAGSSTQPITFTSNISGSTYNWSNNLPSIGLGANGNGNIGSFFGLNSSQQPTTAQINVVPIYSFGSQLCTGQALSFEITVLPLPVVIPNLDATFCHQSSVNIAFSSTSNPVSFDWISFPNNIGLATSGQGDINFTSLNTSASNQTATAIVNATFTLNTIGCTGPNDTLLITVLPEVLTTGSPNQLLCNGDSSALVIWNSSLPNAQFTWQSFGANTGFLTIGSGNVAPTSVSNTSNQLQQTLLVGTAALQLNGVTCPGIPDTVSIQVNPTPLLNFGQGNQLLCSGDSSQQVSLNSNVLGVNFSWTLGNISPGISGWTQASGSGLLPAALLTNSGSNTGTIQFSAFATTSGQLSCPGPSVTYLIDVLAIPVITVPNDTVFCSQSAVSGLNLSSSGSTLSWTNSNPNIGLAANGTGNISPFIIQNNSLSPISSTLIATPAFANGNLFCTGLSDTFLITVNPIPSAVPPATLNLCNGDSSAMLIWNGNATQYNWVNPNPSIGLLSSGIGDLPAFIAANNTNLVNSSTLTITPSYTHLGLTCIGQNVPLTINVTPNPTINPTADVVFCAQTTINQINFSGSANTYTWSNNNPSIGLAANGIGNIGPFSAQNGSVQLLNEAQITVQASYSFNNLICPGDIDTFLISIAPTPVVQALSNQVWCNGTSTTIINLTGTGTTYNWTNDNPSIGLAANGIDSIPVFNTTNTGLSTNNALINVTPIYAIGGLNCPGNPSNFNIAVMPSPTVNAQQDLYFCANSAIAPLPFTGTASYFTWTNSNTNIGLSNTGIGTALTAFTSSNLDSLIASSLVTVLPIIDTGQLSCTGSAEIFEINILPIATATSINHQEICSGTASNPVLFTGPVNNTQFIWQHNTSNLPLAQSGVGNIGAYTLTNFGNMPIQLNFLVTPTTSFGALTCPGTPLTFDWTILPAPTVTNLGPLVYCAATPVAAQQLTGTANHFTWINNNSSTGLPAVGQDSLPAFVATNNSAAPNEALITITPIYQTPSQTCNGNPFTIDLIVNPTAIVNGISNQDFCHQELTNTTHIGGTGTSYQWSNDNPLIGLPSSGSNQVPSFVAQNNSNQTIQAQISIQPIYTNLGLSCPGDSASYSITVHPQPLLLATNDTIICNGGSISYNLTSNVNATYSWLASSNPMISGAAQTPQTNPVISQTLVNNSNSPQSISYTISPTSSFGCVGPDSSFLVIVQPDVQLSVPSTMEICSGSPVNAFLNANVSSNFNWFVTVDNPNVSGESINASIGNYINDVLINNTSVNQIVVYAITPLAVAGGCSGGVQTLSVLVKPPLQLLNTDTLSICSGTAVNLDLVANTNVSFTWYADQNINVSGESTGLVSGAQINDLLQNTSNQVQEVLYHVTGTAAINGCSTPIFPIWVQVLPTPQVFAPNELTLCHNTVQASIIFNGNNNGNTYNWLASGAAIGLLNNSGQQLIPSFTTVNNGSLPIQTTISILPSLQFNGQNCNGISENFDIVILPEPTVTAINDLNFCEGDQSPQLNFSGAVPASTFNWSNTNSNIGLGTIGSNFLPVFGTQTLGQQLTQGQIVVVPSYAFNNLTCDGDPQTFSITVHPLPTVLSSNSSICSGEAVDLLLDASIPSQFTWQATAQPEVYGESTNTPQNSNLIDDTLSQTTNIVQGVEYTVTANAIASGCQSLPVTIAVSVNPLPQIDFAFTGTSLCDQSPVQFQNNTPGSNNFLWDFGDATSSILNNPNHTYPGPGSYTVTLSATDANTGCSAQDSLLVQIGSLPIAAFEISDSVGCGSLDVSFVADSVNQGWTYLWDFGNGQTSPQIGTTTTQFDQIGCYDLSLTVTNAAGCVAQTSYTDGVCVFANPVAAFEASDYILDSNEPMVSLTNNSLNSVSYTWDFGDGQTSFATDPQHMYPSTVATYSIQLVAFNEVNCTDTSSLTISIVEDLRVYVPNSFTPNDDENNQQFLPILSAGFKTNTYHLLIFDRWGEIVFESRDPQVGWDGYKGFSMTPCQDGTYTWKISVVIAASQETKVFAGHVNLLR